MSLRAGHLGFFVLRQAGRKTLSRAAAVFFFVGVLMLYVAGKVMIVQLGYEIEAVEREKKQLERENRSLRIEASSLLSSARIEEIAIKRLGMIRPSKENIVVVKRADADSTGTESGEQAGHF